MVSQCVELIVIMLTLLRFISTHTHTKKKGKKREGKKREKKKEKRSKNQTRDFCITS